MPTNAEYLARVTLFSELATHRLEALGAVCQRRQVDPGTVILREGEAGNALYIVVGGLVRIERNSDRGDTHVLAIRESGQAIGEMALIENRPRSANAIAQTTTRLLELSREDFRTQLMTDPEICFALLQSLAGRLRESGQLIVDRRSKRVEARLAEFLKLRADAGGRITVPMNQSELADVVGCTREALNRAIRLLTDQKVIEKIGPTEFQWLQM